MQGKSSQSHCSVPSQSGTPLPGCFWQPQSANLGISLTKLRELPTCSEILCPYKH